MSPRTVVGSLSCSQAQVWISPIGPIRSRIPWWREIAPRQPDPRGRAGGVRTGGLHSRPRARGARRPLFTSEADAFAAAEETYRAYVDALNQVDLSDPETFEDVYAWTTGDANADARETFSQMHADGWTVQGDTVAAVVVTLTSAASKDSRCQTRRVPRCLRRRVCSTRMATRSSMPIDRTCRRMLVSLDSRAPRLTDLLSHRRRWPRRTSRRAAESRRMRLRARTSSGRLSVLAPRLTLQTSAAWAGHCSRLQLRHASRHRRQHHHPRIRRSAPEQRPRPARRAPRSRHRLPPPPEPLPARSLRPPL